MADIQGNLWLCTDCTVKRENDDTSGMDANTAALVLTELEGLDYTANFNSDTEDGIRENSHKYCDGCGREYYGTFFRYALWSK